MCQCCDYGHRIGCEFAEEFACPVCFETIYKNKPVYCQDKDCDCDNKNPKQRATKRYKQAFEKLPLPEFDIVEWRRTHRPVNYPGKYTGRYLIDIALSDDDFERGYIQWLIKEGSNPTNASKYSPEQEANFQHYVLEAREIEQLLSKRRYSFRSRNKEV